MLKEAKILLLVVLIDLLITNISLASGFAKEEAPLLSWYYQLGGIVLLSSVKLSLTAGGIYVMECAWFYSLVKKEIATAYYRFAIGAYLGIFIVGIAKANFLI